MTSLVVPCSYLISCDWTSPPPLLGASDRPPGAVFVTRLRHQTSLWMENNSFSCHGLNPLVCSDSKLTLTQLISEKFDNISWTKDRLITWPLPLQQNISHKQLFYFPDWPFCSTSDSLLCYVYVFNLGITWKIEVTFPLQLSILPTGCHLQYLESTTDRGSTHWKLSESDCHDRRKKLRTLPPFLNNPWICYNGAE